MSNQPIKRGEVKGGTLYEIVPPPGSPPRRDYILIDKDGKAHALLRDEARKLMASLKPSEKHDPALARFAKSYETALAGFNLGEKGLREMDKDMEDALKGSGGAPKDYEPGPQEPPRKKVSAIERFRELARGDAELPISKVDAGEARTPKGKTQRVGGLGLPKEADPKLMRYESAWQRMDAAMVNPKQVNLDSFFRKLNETKTAAGISDEQFQYEALPHLRQWMTSIGNDILNSRKLEASDEFNEGPLVRPSGLDAYAGVAKLKAAVLALDPAGYITESDIRDTTSPGWQQAVVALNQQFDKTLDALAAVQPGKGKVGKEVALSTAEMLHAEAKSLASYALDRQEAMTRIEETYQETMRRLL